MTLHLKEPFDCDHESVCWKFRYDKKQQEGMLEFCGRKGCINDTRSRPHPAPYTDNLDDALESLRHDKIVASKAREGFVASIKEDLEDDNEWNVNPPTCSDVIEYLEKKLEQAGEP